MPEVLLHNINKEYDSFSLRNINLSFGKRGKITCLVGCSGSGKSTILKLISGLDSPISGSIQIGDKKVFDNKAGLNAPPEHRNTALIFQQPSLFNNKTVLENIKFAVKNTENSDKVARSMLEIVGMQNHANKMPYQLSGGQQQLITLARAFAQNPSLILLDEPFSSLDTMLRSQIRNKVVTLIKDMNLISVIVTHDPTEALQIADEIIVIQDGAVIMHDNPNNIYYKPNNFHVACLFGHVNHVKGYVKNNMLISAWGEIKLQDGKTHCNNFYIRPEGLTMDEKSDYKAKAYIEKVNKFSNYLDIIVDKSRYKMRLPIYSLPRECDTINVSLNADYLMCFI